MGDAVWAVDSPEVLPPEFPGVALESPVVFVAEAPAGIPPGALAGEEMVFAFADPGVAPLDAAMAGCERSALAGVEVLEGVVTLGISFACNASATR